MRSRHIKRIISGCIWVLTLCGDASFAQDNAPKPGGGRPTPQMPVLPPQLMPPHPPAKMRDRYFDIDAKRQVENMEGEDALPRSREFKRIDSTYYVGWMYEGVYKFNHAADYAGFRHAAIPLERALALMEHDYAKALSTRTDQPLTLYPIRIFLPDYTLIAYDLMTCYSNTDQPDKVFELLQRVKKWKFQAAYYMDTYDYLAWTVHRNRFYTSAKYGFLKNSIDENERLANRYLDTALLVIEKNKGLNISLETLFPFFRGNAKREREGVYFYRSMLASYAFKIDTANYYFGMLRDAGKLPHNNYANFMLSIGDFKTAEAEYAQAANEYPGDKRLQEWAYYTSILDLYKGKPKAGALLSRGMIKAAGSTPGYGWYNIALARAMLYDGRITESARYLDKAAEFKEVHIGTTLGQSHYDFSIQLMKLINKEQSRRMDQFEHADWWYNPKVLLSMAQKLSEKYLQQFLIINQFAQNPERDRVIYKLFSTESTVSWDEIWYLIHDFSTEYFIRMFERSAVNDNRPLTRKYFALFTARLKMEQGKYAEAQPILDKVSRDPGIDEDYEKLFMARVFQAGAECAKERNNTTALNDLLYRMYVTFPQLVPFTGMPANLTLHLGGDVDKRVEQRLKGCGINWVANSAIPAAHAYVIFSHSGKRNDITYYVLDKNGNYIVNKQSFAWQKPDEAGTELAYRLFNIGGNEAEDEPDTKAK